MKGVRPLKLRLNALSLNLMMPSHRIGKQGALRLKTPRQRTQTQGASTQETPKRQGASVNESEAIDDILTNAPKITNSYPHRHSLAQNVVCVLTHDDLRYSVRESDLPRPKQHILTPLATHTPTPRPRLVLIPPNGRLRARKSGARWAFMKSCRVRKDARW